MWSGKNFAERAGDTRWRELPAFLVWVFADGGLS